MESIFANRFKRFRKSLDLTQVELAKVAGLSQANITAWGSGKKGTKPSRESLIKLQKAFDWLDIDWLLDGVGQMKIEKQVLAEEPQGEYKAMPKEPESSSYEKAKELDNIIKLNEKIIELQKQLIEANDKKINKK